MRQPAGRLTVQPTGVRGQPWRTTVTGQKAPVRGSAQADVEALAEFAGVPVWNGLTDDWHPTQMLADILTMHDRCPGSPDEVSYC